MSAEYRLYVGNLRDDITATALRMRFELVGKVADVELAIDRASGRMRGFAFVTMADQTSYDNAIARLNGVTFEERVLRVCEPSEGKDEQTRGRGKKEAKSKATVTSQFRERTCMALELDCEGTKLAFKMYPTQVEGHGDSWRIEASCPSLIPPSQLEASAATRREAFKQIEKDWAAPSLDWRAIEEALENVRAI